MPRDNLLNSASLEFFEFMRKENLKQLIVPLVENYREKLLGITYVNIFESLVNKYDSIQNGSDGDEASFTTQGADTPSKNLINSGQRWQGLRDADAEEEAYFNASDGEEEDEASLPTSTPTKPVSNGASPVRPLVAYPDDDDDVMEGLSASPSTPSASQEKSRSPTAADNGSPNPQTHTPVSSAPSPPERLSEKRRREEDDEDDMEKLAGGGAKRRNSTSSIRSELSATNIDNGSVSPRENGKPAPTTPILRRKGSLKSKDGGPGPHKGISIGPISLSLKDGDAESKS